MKNRADQLITVLTKYTLKVTSLRRYQNKGVDFYSPRIFSRIWHSFYQHLTG